MDKEALLQRITETQNKFDKVFKDRDLLNEELVRLQGEYRAYSDLLTKLEETQDATVKSKPISNKRSGE